MILSRQRAFLSTGQTVYRGARVYSQTTSDYAPNAAPTIRRVLSEAKAGDQAVMKGWVRSIRRQKSVSFAQITDGSSLAGVQAVMSEDQARLCTNGACVELKGSLLTSPGKGQALELGVTELSVLGPCEQETYPLQKKHQSWEYLREMPHLRPRTHSGGSVLRIRDTALRSLRTHFHAQEYTEVTMPMLTSHDCEGGGEAFEIRAGGEEPFFGKPIHLTVSGQLHLEAMALAIGRVYTLGPAFRAEPSRTSRHLSEFWMLEAEVPFVGDLASHDASQGLLDACGESVKAAALAVLHERPEDLHLLNRWVDPTLLSRLDRLSQGPYPRLTYTEAIAILEKAHATQAFVYPPSWGAGIQSEHERFLAEKHVGGPVFITDYPKEQKPFYMRINPDGRTVACFDLLIPRVGELVGGSIREERPEPLDVAMRAAGLPADQYAWYQELREWGGAPHGGWGMGVERLVASLTGMESVKEVIPFPRWAGTCRA